MKPNKSDSFLNVKKKNIDLSQLGVLYALEENDAGNNSDIADNNIAFGADDVLITDGIATNKLVPTMILLTIVLHLS